jgi:hypothetical protein
MLSDFVFAYAICYSTIFSYPSVLEMDIRENVTYHFLPKEFKPLQCSHSLCCCLDISIYNVCLPTHLHCLKSYNIYDWTIGGEEGIE